MERNIKGLFVADLDGTLLTDDKQIVTKDLEALFLLQQMGFLTAVATGRSNFSINKLLTTFSHIEMKNSLLPVDYIIFSTGAGIMNYPGMNILRSLTLGAEDVRFISSILENFAIDYMIHRPIPDTKYFLYSEHGKPNPDFHTRLNLYKDFATPFSSSILNKIIGATEILCIFPEEVPLERVKQLVRIFNRFSVIMATSPLDHKSIWVEIFFPAASKSQAIQWLCENLNISRSSVCAVGNDYNDEDLLCWARTSYIVANSPSTMRNNFPKVASNNNAGVSEAIALWLNSLQITGQLTLAG